MTGFCSDPRFALHATGPHHPERPDRIRTIHRAVREAGLVSSPDPFPDFEIDLGPLSRAAAPLVELPAPDPIDRQWLLSVHTPEHVERVMRVCKEGGGVLDQGDTPV